MLLQEMQEVFGDVDDLLTMYAERRTTALEGIDEEDEEAVELDDEDSDAIAAHEEQVVSRSFPSLFTACFCRHKRSLH